jgi:hypothetical protein
MNAKATCASLTRSGRIRRHRNQSSWETKEQGERFVNERVLPLVAEVASDAAPPRRQYFYELHDLISQ